MKVTHLIFKYLFLFTLLLGIVGCEKEEINQPEINQTTSSGKSSMTRVNVKDISSLDQFVQSKMSGFQKSEFNAMSSIVTPLGIVPMEDVLQVIDGEGNTNYSFRIVPENLTSLSVYNLIIHQGPDGEEPIAYILEYIREYDDNGNLNPYAKIKKYPYEIMQKSLSAKVGCEGGGEDKDQPCLEIVLDTNTPDGSGDSNSSSGGDGSNDGIIASPVGPITESTTNVVITISGDPGETTTEDPDTQTNSPRGCAVIDQIFYDENGNIRVTTIWVDECPYNTDDKSSGTITIGKMSGCSEGGGDVAIDLMGLTLMDMNLLSTTLGLDNVLWLNEDCELDDLVNQMFARTQKTTADAQLMASLVNFWRATEGNLNAFILSLDIITARERGEITLSQALLLFRFLEENNLSEEAKKEALLTLVTETSQEPWINSNGMIDGNSKLTYTAYRDLTINGQIIREFKLLNEDRLARGNYALCSGCSESEDRTYYLEKGAIEWHQLYYKPDGTTADLDFLIEAFWDGAKFVGRYIIPVEDVIIAIDGRTFEGEVANRYFAGGMLILSVVPGSKLLKPVLKLASNATVWKVAFKVGDRTVKFTSEIVDGIVKFGNYNSSKFRKVVGLLPGDPRQAHHLLPRGQSIINHPVIQKLAKYTKKPFHIDNPLNGIPIEAWRNQPNHNNYNRLVEEALDAININQSEELIILEVENLLNRIRNAIVQNPNVHLNDLIF